jgi:O-antigen/teichoic acid export membrane protein
MTEQRAPRDLTGTVVRGVGLAGGGYAIAQGINLLIYLVLARLATPEDFGQLAAGAVLVQAGLWFADSGLSAALIQRRDRVEEAASTAAIATILGGIALGLAALAVSPLIGHFFDSHEVTLVAAASAGWIVIRAPAAIPDAIMQRRFIFLRRAVVDPLGIVVFGAVAIPTTAAGLGVWGLVLGNYAQFAIMSISSWVLARWRPRLRLASVAMWRELVGFGRHVLAAGVIARVTGMGATGIIGRGLGTEVLGQFRYGDRIVQGPLGGLINVGSHVLFPAFSRISTDAPRFERGFRQGIRLTCLVGMPASLALLPLGTPMAVILFGEQWRVAGHLASAMFAYAAARALIAIIREAFKASGRSELLSKLQIVSGVLTIGLMIAALPLGAVAVGASNSVSAIGAAAYAIRGVSPVTGIPVRRLLGEIWPSLLASAPMAGVLYLVELWLNADGHGTGLGAALLAGEVALGITIYLAALAVIAPSSARELIGMIRSLRRRRRQPAPEAKLEAEREAELEEETRSVMPGP